MIEKIVVLIFMTLGLILLGYWIKNRNEEKVLSILAFVFYIIGATFLSAKYLYYDIKLKNQNEIEKKVEEIYKAKESKIKAEKDKLILKNANYENKIDILESDKKKYEEKSKLYYSLLDEKRSFPRLIESIEKLKKEKDLLIEKNEKLSLMLSTKEDKSSNHSDIVKYDISEKFEGGGSFIDKLTKASLSIRKIAPDNTGLMNLSVPGKEKIEDKKISASLVDTFQYKEKNYNIYVEKINYYSGTFTVRVLEQ